MLGRLSAFARTGPLGSLTFGNSLAGVRASNPATFGRFLGRAPSNHLVEYLPRVSPLSRRFGKAQPDEIDASVLNDTAKLEELSVKGRLVHAGHEKKVGYWLLLCAGAVFGMIILGGYTRLSKSGLSMVKWKPIEYSYPTTCIQMFACLPVSLIFDRNPIISKIAGPMGGGVRALPEKIDLERFKSIFLVEYAHRVYGSSLGVLFSVPLAYFWIRGYLKKSMKLRMLGLLALGGSQGLIGWWMVRSGLGPKPQYHREPRVSVYRLSVHLTAAMTIYSFLLWNGFTLLRNPPETVWRGYRSYEGMLKGRKWAIAALHTLYLTIVAGSVVAGLDAGKVFNTWPLMNGA